MFAIAQPEPGCRLRLRIFIEQKHVDRAYRTLFDDLMNRGNIPGFRKGKVPIWRIRREYGPKAIDGAVYADLMEQALRCVATYADVHPTQPADFEEEEDARLAEESRPLTTEALVLHIRPELRLPGGEGLELKTPEIEPTDEQIDDELKRLQDAAAQLVGVERKEVQQGDQVEIVMRSKVEGEEGEPSPQDESLIVGEDRYDPPLDTYLLGHRVGETVEFSVDYPDRPQLGKLAGKRVHVSADIKDLRERKVPALDDEFARQAMEDCESLEALRDEVRQRLRRENEQLARAVERVQVGRWLENSVRIDLPEAVLERAEEEAADADSGEALAEDALQMLKVAYASEAILADRGVGISDDELRQAYVELGMTRGLDPSILLDDRLVPEVAGLLRDRIARRKAADLIAATATKKLVPLSDLAEELREAVDETGEGSDEPTEEQDDEGTD